MIGHVHTWHPEVPSLREVYHARFDHSYPMHTHDDWAVMIVDDGAVVYGLDRVEHHATAATVTLLPPGIPHDGRSATVGSDYRKRVLYLEADWLPDKAQSLAAHSPTLPGAAPLLTTRRVHAALAHPGDAMAAEHWLLTIRRNILTHLGKPVPTVRDVPLARRLRQLIDDRYTDSFTITAVARELNAHPSHLVRVFSQTYGIAPHQYQISRRIDLARRLIVEGHRPSEAAALTRFPDQAHLTRHFRRVLGVTPTALTRQ